MKTRKKKIFILFVRFFIFHLTFIVVVCLFLYILWLLLMPPQWQSGYRVATAAPNSSSSSSYIGIHNNSRRYIFQDRYTTTYLQFFLFCFVFKDLVLFKKGEKTIIIICKLMKAKAITM